MTGTIRPVRVENTAFVPDQPGVQVVQSTWENQGEDDGQTADAAGEDGERLQLVPGQDLLQRLAVKDKYRGEIQQYKSPCVNDQIDQSLQRGELESYPSLILVQSYW